MDDQRTITQTAQRSSSRTWARISDDRWPLLGRMLSRVRSPRLLWWIPAAAFAVQLFQCGGDGGVELPEVIYQGGASDEALERLFDKLDEAVSDASPAARITAPTDAAELPADPPPTITWEIQNPMRSEAPLRFRPRPNPSPFGFAAAQAHLPPVTGMTYLTIVRDTTQVPPRGDPARGAEVHRLACSVCHGEASTGAQKIREAPVLPEEALQGARDEFPEFPPAAVFVEKIRHGRFFGVGGIMPPYSLEALSDADVGALLAFYGL